MKIRLDLLLESLSRGEWWDRLSERQQRAYIDSHKKTTKTVTKHGGGKPGKPVDGPKRGRARDDFVDDFVDTDDDDNEGLEHELDDGEDSPVPRYKPRGTADPESARLHKEAMEQIQFHERELARLRQHTGGHAVDARPAPAVHRREHLHDLIDDGEGETDDRDYHETIDAHRKGQLVSQEVERIKPKKAVETMLGHYTGKHKELSDLIGSAGKFLLHSARTFVHEKFNFDPEKRKVVRDDPEFEKFRTDPAAHKFVTWMGTTALTMASSLLGLDVLVAPMAEMLTSDYFDHLDQKHNDEDDDEEAILKRLLRKHNTEAAKHPRTVTLQRSQATVGADEAAVRYVTDKDGKIRQVVDKSLRGTSRIARPVGSINRMNPNVENYTIVSGADANLGSTEITDAERSVLMALFTQYKQWLAEQDLGAYIRKLENTNDNSSEVQVGKREEHDGYRRFQQDSGQAFGRKGLQVGEGDGGGGRDKSLQRATVRREQRVPFREEV